MQLIGLDRVIAVSEATSIEIVLISCLNLANDLQNSHLRVKQAQEEWKKRQVPVSPCFLLHPQVEEKREAVSERRNREVGELGALIEVTRAKLYFSSGRS